MPTGAHGPQRKKKKKKKKNLLCIRKIKVTGVVIAKGKLYHKNKYVGKKYKTLQNHQKKNIFVLKPKLTVTLTNNTLNSKLHR